MTTDQRPALDTDAIHSAALLLTGRLRHNVDPLFALRMDGVKAALGPQAEAVVITRDELRVVLLALADRQDHAETECWREDRDDTRSTHDPDCDCWWAKDAREAIALTETLEKRAGWL